MDGLRRWTGSGGGRAQAADGLIALGGDETVLEPGEAAEFDTRVPHGTASASLEPAEIINLLSTQGERVHLSAASAPRPPVGAHRDERGRRRARLKAFSLCRPDSTSSALARVLLAFTC